MADDFDAKIKQKAKTESKYSCSVCGRTFVCVPFKHLANGKICDGQVAEEKWILVDDILAVYAETQRQHKQQLQDLNNILKSIDWSGNSSTWKKKQQTIEQLGKAREIVEGLLSEGLEHG